MTDRLVDCFSESTTQCIALALVHFLWQGAVIWLVLAAVLRAVRDGQADGQAPAGANMRYLLCCFGLMTMAVLPIVNVLWIGVPVAMFDGKSAAAQDSTEKPSADPLLVSADPPISTEVDGIGTEGGMDDRTGRAAQASLLSRAGRLGLRWFFWIWLSGVAVLSAWHLLGWSLSQRLRSRGREPRREITRIVASLAKRFGVHKPIMIRETVRMSGPLVMGWLKPVLIVPAGVISGLSPSELEAVLAHELAHVKRHDYLVNLLQSFVETVLFYHPAVWWVSRQIRTEREFCVDDMAMRVCAGRETYVRSLLSVAELVRHRPRQAPAATGGSLTARIRRLLPGEETRRSRSDSRRSVLVPLLTVVCLVATFIAIAQSQSNPEASAENASLPAPESVQPNQPSSDKPPTIANAKNDSLTSLADAVRSINEEAGRRPIAKQLEPLTEEQVVAEINRLVEALTEEQVVAEIDRLVKPRDPTDEDYQAIKDIGETRRLPQNVSLRQFFRYNDGVLMQHGSWVRLMIERKNGGPFSLSIRSNAIFKRPYTQKERAFRRGIDAGAGIPTLNRLVTYFKDDPEFGTEVEQSVDYDGLVENVRKSIEKKDVNAILALVHWKGVEPDDRLRQFIRQEVEELIRRGVSKISVQPKQFTGELYQWQGFKIYGPNLPVEAYLSFTFAERTEKDAASVSWEVGAQDGQPRFVCHVVIEGRFTELIGKPSHGPIVSSGFMVVSPDGAIEFGSNIEAPDSIPELNEANRELIRSE